MRDSILLRVPAELKNDLRLSAEEKGMTLNAFILQILWEWAEKENVSQ